MASTRGSGTRRERRPGVWEIRVAAGTDPVTGRTLQRSVSFHGDEAAADAYQRDLADQYRARRSVARAAPHLTVGELLERWLEADHPWRPSTRIGYRSNVRLLRAETIAGERVVSLTPTQVRAAMARWQAEGTTTSAAVARFRVLRSAIGWAYDERIIDHHPIRNMRGPTRSEPRRPLHPDEVRRLLGTAESRVLVAVANDDGTPRALRHRQAAEQDLLCVRLAADSGARRGELAALRFDDLTGRVLQIRRSVSGDEITLPKSGRPRTLTLGTQTAALWHTLEADWRQRGGGSLDGPWLFARDTNHRHRLTAAVFDRRFRAIRDEAGVPTASLHRFRHSVATFLVARGEVLQAQARLGHADPSTTLREYAYALPGTDAEVADALDRHLDEAITGDTSLGEARRSVGSQGEPDTSPARPERD